ncbi:hypothetical protein [Exiguobacterium sp. SH5S13]|uniref:hypothetical protein n=1 Tax=Exiguobacterium sp. SH5S13 TaxID=2510959 RepID=UPI0013758072|nr:hypothetical protein [Exiguobacterium sp. SH5S13]
MRNNILLALSCVISLAGCSIDPPKQPPQDYDSEFPVETFIRDHLLTAEGLLRTNMTDRDSEFLSESIGLYLLFLVERKRENEFADQIAVLTDHFLDESDLITWKLDRTGDALVASPVNAWIDDARIVHALYEAAQTFDEPEYAELASRISVPLTTVATKQGLPVDYVDLKTNETSDVITLSYLDEAALEWMAPASTLYTNSKNLLLDAPIDGPFFAKAYSITDGTYSFDSELNLIDQVYVALRYEQFDLPTDRFYEFFKMVFDSGPVYGRYDRKTQAPTVDYESQAVYALAVFYLLERDEPEFAEQVMTRLRGLAVQDETAALYGGYVDVKTRHTHSFDNLLPLLAEGRLLDGRLIP